MVKVDQLTYYDPNAPTAPENVLPMIEQHVSSATTSVVSSMGPIVYLDAPMTSNFQSIPPPSPATDVSDLCTLSHNTHQPSLLPKPPLVPSHIGATPIHTIPFHFPPSGVVSAPVMATLSLPGLTLGLPVWYLSPPVPPPTPDVVLQPVQPIVTTSQPHPGVTTPSSSMNPSLLLLNPLGAEAPNLTLLSHLPRQ